MSGYYRCASCRSGTNIYRWGLFAVMLVSFLRYPMVFIKSTKNNCTYKLDANNQRVLMYAPLLPDGSYETAGSAYDWVEWDCLDDDILAEADRCHKLLLEDVTL